MSLSSLVEVYQKDNSGKNSLTINDSKQVSGVFRIKFYDDEIDEFFNYNIEEKKDNIDPTRPIFWELFDTEIGKSNEKYGFLMIDKLQYIPETEEDTNDNSIFFNDLYKLKIYNLTNYIPKWCNKYDYNSKKILDLKNGNAYSINYYYKLTYEWLENNNLLNENTIIAVVPSHIENLKNYSGISYVARKIINNSDVIDGVNLIYRKKTINKKATSIHRISLKEDISSLDISKNIDLSNKTIVILDDVVTHGDSFRAVAYHLYVNGAEKIIPLAMGKTVIPDE